MVFLYFTHKILLDIFRHLAGAATTFLRVFISNCYPRGAQEGSRKVSCLYIFLKINHTGIVVYRFLIFVSATDFQEPEVYETN